VGGDAEQVHPPGGQFDDEQDVEPGEQQGGLTRVAHGELEPDNPIDDRRHYVYRIDRPTT
jgi:hypothetical protein